MSYKRVPGGHGLMMGPRARRAMGDTTTDVVGALTTIAGIGGVTNMLRDAVADPYLPDIVQSILTLDAVQNNTVWPQPTAGQDAVNSIRGAVGQNQASQGLGLGPVSYALSGFVAAKQIPFGVPIFVALLLGIPFAIGYSMRK